ncbi:MAG TPA: DUF3618 domain-containing protein [Rubricoccaceae bacterium]|jgi:uncharacterized protein YjbJ (UPF0337 family)
MAQESDRLSADTDTTDPAQIEREIERTRADMTETIDALGARFQPSYIKEQAQEAIVDTARSAGTSMIDTLRDNPLPAAVAGLSIAWLIANRSSGSRPPSRPYRGYAQTGTYSGGRYATGNVYAATPAGTAADGTSLTDRAGDVADRARDLAGGARDRAADLVGHVGDQAADLGQQAQEVAGRAGSWLEDQMDQNPLGVGAVALVAGALVGLSFPATDAEASFMGRPAAQLVGQVKEAAGERIDQVKEVAGRVADEAKEKAAGIVETVKSEAKDVAQTATDEVKGMADKGGSGGGSGSAAPSGGSPPAGGPSPGALAGGTGGGQTGQASGGSSPGTAGGNRPM